MPRIVINTTDLKQNGGVSQYLKNLNLTEIGGIEYFNIQGNQRNYFSALLRIVRNYFIFEKKIKEASIVHLNPSLDLKSFLRDAGFIFIGLKRKKKVIVTMHGWKDDFEEKLKQPGILRTIFKKTYAKVPFYIVLGNHLKKKLERLGVNKHTKFFIETTVIKDPDGSWRPSPKVLREPIQFLFLSRIEKEKGVYIAIDTVVGLSKMHPCELIIAGNGSEYRNVSNYINRNGYSMIKLIGHVEGKEKIKTLREAHIMLFPTYFGEGLPTTILEGFLYGLPVISRNNAAIPEVVIDGKNGYLTDSKDKVVFINLCKKLLDNRELYSQMSMLNQITAKSRFVGQKARERMLSIYNEIEGNGY